MARPRPRPARIAAFAAVALGAVALVDLVSRQGAFELCALIPFHCAGVQPSGRAYFEGDSPISPTFQVVRSLVAPLLLLYGTTIARERPLLGRVLAAAAGSVIAWPQLAGTYALLPFDPLVLLAACIALGASLFEAAERKSPESRSPTERR